MARNLGELITDVRQTIGQTDESNSNFTDAQLTTWINDGYIELVRRLQHLPLRSRDYTESGGTVTLNSNIMEVKIARFLKQPESEYYELEVISFPELIQVDPDYENATTGQPRYLVRTAGKEDCILYPAPDSDNSGSTVRVMALEAPSEMSGDSDTPDLPPETHRLLANFAAFRALQFLQRSQDAANELTLFRAGVRDMRNMASRVSQKQSRWTWGDDT